MTDNFDKEAADVMENPMLEDNLPDFSVVVIKKEVINFYDSDFESTTSSIQDRKPLIQEEIIPKSPEDLRLAITNTEGFQNRWLNCNKIVLGSKPNIVHSEEDNVTISVKEENHEFFENHTDMNSSSIDENVFEELVTSYELKIELHDIKPYLLRSRRYCETCSILFPEPNTFERHVQMFHTEKSPALISDKKNDLSKRRIYKCRICGKKFVTLHVLRTHLNNIHRLNSGNTSKTKNRKYKHAYCRTMWQNRCSICGLKFVTPHLLKTHLLNIHKLNYAKVTKQQNSQSATNTMKDNNCQILNHDNTSVSSNTCFHCKKPFETQKSLIEHLYDVLQMKRKNTEIVPVLKSVLFKCNKCDIHFSSSQFAANHAEHMEMLINWKCTVCNRIFKNEDALSHERQHSVTNNFTVYNLADIDVTNILYKCSKCAIHFTESNFLYHFRDCGLEYSKFINCHVCNMSLDYNLKTLHESDNHNEPNAYTIIESDVVSDNPVKSTTDKYQPKEKLKDLLKSFRDVKVVLRKIDSSKVNKINQFNTEKRSFDECVSELKSSSYQDIRINVPNTTEKRKNTDLGRRRNLTYYFCETCKCFMTRHTKTIHLEARCQKLSKEACKHCGLMLTTGSWMIHRQLHKEKKNLSLRHLKLLHLYNGKPINPSGSEVLNVQRTVNVRNQQGNRNLGYYYCETCKCCITKFEELKNIMMHKRQVCKTWTKTSCKYCGLMFTSASINAHTRLHEENKEFKFKNLIFFNICNDQPMKPPVPEHVHVNESGNNEAETESIEQSENINDCHSMRNLIYYYCETCKCCLPRKKNIHLKARCTQLATSPCKLCGLNFTSLSIMTHMRLHENIKNLNLDNFKFFGLYSNEPIDPPVPEITSVNQSKDNEAEAESTERSEKTEDCHLMPNLIYYYCETCKCCLARKTKIHLKAQCTQLATSPCKLCGLNFTSLSIMTHMRLHENIKNLNLDTFKFFGLYSNEPIDPPVPELTSVNQSEDNEAEADSTDRSENTEDCHLMPNLIYYYCETCKCCLARKKNIHLKARCTQLTTSPCKLCGLNFTSLSIMTHMQLHENIKNLTLDKFKFFGLYNNEPIDPPVPELTSVYQSEDKEAETESTERSENMNDCHSMPNAQGQPTEPSEFMIMNRSLKEDEVEVEHLKRSGDIDDSYTRTDLFYYYCETCKCCLTKRIDVHLKARCFKLAKSSCEHCGLTFTNLTMINHMRLHEERKDLSLNNFKFYNLSNGQPSNPPILDALNIIRPINTEPTAEYVNNDGEVLHKTMLLENKGWAAKRSLAYYFCGTCKCFVTNYKKKVHLESRCKHFSKKACKVCGIMLTTASWITHTKLHKKTSLSINNFKFFNLYNGQPINPAIHEVSNRKRTDKISKQHGRRNLTYLYCETCKCFLTKYNNAKLHKRKRCKVLSKASCEFCGLMFTNASMMTHKRLHEERKELTLKNFKLFYLHNGQPMNIPAPEFITTNPSVNNDSGAENTNRQENIEKWHTRCNLTYYYCETCKCFITKFKKEAHLQGRCKTLVKKSCNQCGLMFTGGSIMTHLRLHKEKKDLSLNDFNFLNLYDGQPMNAPVPKVINYKCDINVEAEIHSKLRPVHNEAECDSRIVSTNIRAQSVNENCPEDIEGETVNVRPLLRIGAENQLENIAGAVVNLTPSLNNVTKNKILFVNDFAEIKNNLENIDRDVSVTPPLDIETGYYKESVNIETEVGNANRPINIEGDGKDVTSLTRIEVNDKELPLNNDSEILHFSRPMDNEAELVENKNQTKYIEGGAKNVPSPLHIEAEKEKLRLDNESDCFYFERPINIKFLAGNENRSQNIEGEAKNVTSHIEPESNERFSNIHIYLEGPTNIEAELDNGNGLENEAEIGIIKQLVNNKTENENVLQRTNIEANTGSLGAINEDRVLNLTLSGNIEAEIKNINNNTKDASITGDVNNETLGLKISMNSGLESAMNRLSLDSETDSNPETTDASEIRSANNSVKLPQTKVNAKLEVGGLKFNMIYYYCHVCKCCETEFMRQNHIQAGCMDIAKSTCIHCGLMFTKASMITHKRMHRERKDFSLFNFKFFNLHNGQPIDAPIPKAVNRKLLVDKSNLTNYYCATCQCFVDYKCAREHENCNNKVKVPCKHCGIILCGTSFPPHKSLHEERKNLTLDDLIFLDLYSGQPISPPIPKYPKCKKCTVHFLTITARNSHICSEVSSLTCHICKIKLSEAAFKLHMTFHQYQVQSATNLDQNSEKDVTGNSIPDIPNDNNKETNIHSLDVAEATMQRYSEVYSIVYCCRNCSVSVDTYDKAVEHSQTHYESDERVTLTKLCNSCNLKMDEACYINHQVLHERKTPFKILHFDSYYLPAQNTLWIKHIFESLPDKEVSDILRKSIYRFECRIKMHIIQKGDPNFTVYKCDQCNCFIEPSSLSNHSDNACFKLRHHPCTVCGIDFNSSASRLGHEKIHNRPGLTAKSYRIVLFNRERDLQINRSFYLRKKYVLYKCRNCDVILDKPRENVHECDLTNVKNCPDCALLLNTKDYESHLNTHSKFISFNYTNMKVVLLGQPNSTNVRNDNNFNSNFKGAIYDYKMFVCNKCGICSRNQDLLPKHICRFGKQRLKCLLCDLYFSVGSLKTHMRCHQQDPDFVRTNMCIISFEPCTDSTLDRNRNATKLIKIDENCKLSHSNSDSDLESEFLDADVLGTNNETDTVELTTDAVEEETATIYKCTCELHFLNEASIYRHFGTCRSNSKITKLKCQKCGLLFTPNVLFTHLLAHHNNKGRRYKYDIIKINH